MSRSIEGMILLVSLGLVIALPGAAPAAGPEQLCASAKLKAATSFAQCRGKADSSFAKSAKTPADAAKRDGAYGKCSGAMVKAYGTAEAKYPEDCPTVGDVDAVMNYLTQCTGDVYEATQIGGSVPDYPGQIAACAADLGVALSGTATAANVLAGRTFTSASGIGSTGTMPNNGAVAITPGATAQAIPAGYHDGSGTVAGDVNLAAGNIRTGTSIFGIVGTANGGLLATGQKQSFGPGSDGDLQRGMQRSYTVNGDGTVTDNRTGLVWEKKSDDGGIHDQDNVYTWGQSVSPWSMNGTMVTTFLAELNTAPCFANHCDWRIPNAVELESIRDLGTFAPTISAAFNSVCIPGCTVIDCSCTPSNDFWTSTTFLNSPSLAWTVGFTQGFDDYSSKANSKRVRAVRGGA